VRVSLEIIDRPRKFKKERRRTAGQQIIYLQDLYGTTGGMQANAGIRPSA
jgi:hypothetical protein